MINKWLAGTDKEEYWTDWRNYTKFMSVAMVCGCCWIVFCIYCWVNIGIVVERRWHNYWVQRDAMRGGSVVSALGDEQQYANMSPEQIKGIKSEQRLERRGRLNPKARAVNVAGEGAEDVIVSSSDP